MNMRISKFQHPTSRKTPSSNRPIGRSPLGLLLWLAVLSVTVLGSEISYAQSYSIDWYKVSGGGGTSTGGVYSVSGTIGQHDAGGPMNGGSYSVTGGFWALIAPLQTPGAPTLYISRGTNSVTVYWQAVSGWSLQQNNSVTAPAGWSASTGITSSGGTNYLNLTRPTGQLFFRLMAP
jgi:hypothetical protein